MTDKTSRIDALIEREEEALKNAVVKAMKEMSDSATHANIRNYKSAKQALEDYQNKKEGIEKFKTQAAALEYLQRNFIIQKSKLSNDVSAGRCPRKDGYFSSKDLDFYAAAVHLPPANSQAAPKDDGVDRFKRAMAEEREIKVAMLKGNLIDAAEEEARDARILAAIKTDIENNGPAIISELINRVMAIVDDEQIRERIQKLSPELRMTYEDGVAGIFDRYARDGGIEA